MDHLMPVTSSVHPDCAARKLKKPHFGRAEHLEQQTATEASFEKPTTAPEAAAEVLAQMYGAPKLSPKSSHGCP